MYSLFMKKSWSPIQSREVRLVAYVGARAVWGFRGEVMGDLGGQP